MAARTSIEYLRLLQSLLPKGKAWNRDEDSALTEFLYGQAEEFARVDGRSVDLLLERDTRYTTELLIDHENDLGLPDSCSGTDETIQERRLAAHSRLITLGQQNPAYFIELAAAYGWDITITEFSPFWCGFHGAGDECGDQTNIFYWKVTITVTGGEIIYFLSGNSQSGDPLSFILGATSMICTFEKYKPAHTVLIWDFTGGVTGAFSIAFSTAFDSLFQGQPSSEYLEGAFFQSFGAGFDTDFGGGYEKNAWSSAFDKTA